MLRKTRIALSAAIVLSTVFPTLAATKHHRAIHAHSTIYDTASGTIGGGCSPTGVPLCSNICSGTGPSCATRWLVTNENFEVDHQLEFLQLTDRQFGGGDLSRN